MDKDRRETEPAVDDRIDAIEVAIEDKHDAVIAADATGLVRNEEFITLAELSEGGVTPPA